MNRFSELERTLGFLMDMIELPLCSFHLRLVNARSVLFLTGSK